MGLFDVFRCKVNVFIKHDVLFPGNVVEGVMVLDVSSPIDMVACRVKVCGKEKITIRRSSNNSNTTYYETVKMYKQLITVAGHMKCSGQRNKVPIPAGKYTYPFQFQLPPQLPPSFNKTCGDGDNATIQYYVKAYVDIPMGRDAKAKRYFRVLAGMPQQQWIARNPVNRTQQFDVTMCCCIDKGKIMTNFFMDRTVISIDRDNLLVCVDVDNSQGQEPVEALEVSLVAHLEYRAQGLMEFNRSRVGHNFIKQPIPAGQKGRLQGVVPLRRDLQATVTTFNTKCHYTVNIELNIPWASDPGLSFPVQIAHVVDDTNFLPAMEFQQCPYPRVQKAPEFFYVPPPQPVFACNPAPCAPPPNVQMFQPQPPLFSVMPPPGAWSGPVVGEPVQPQPQMTWGAGQPMQPMAPVAPPPPPPPLGEYGAPTGAPYQPPGAPPPQQHPACSPAPLPPQQHHQQTQPACTPAPLPPPQHQGGASYAAQPQPQGGHPYHHQHQQHHDPTVQVAPQPVPQQYAATQPRAEGAEDGDERDMI